MARKRLVRTIALLPLVLIAATFIVVGIVMGLSSLHTTADFYAFVQHGISFLKP